MNKNIGRFISAVLVCHFAAVFALGQSPEAGQLFKGRNVTLYYEIRGVKSGTPLFVINGGPGVDHTYMHSTLHPVSAFDELAKAREVVFYDQRGIGRSPALNQGQSCTVADQVADLDALRAHLGFERIDLLGHSYGGYLGMAYAARYPNRVAHLILSDSGAPKLSDTIFLFEKVFPETNERLEAITITDEATKRASFMYYLSMLFYSPAKRDSYLAKVTTINFNQQVKDAIEKDAEKLDFTPELAKFRVPTLVVTGRFDMNVAPLVAYKIHKAIPGSRLVVFEQSGHLPFYEEQEGFVRLVDGFLSGR